MKSIREIYDELYPLLPNSPLDERKDALQSFFNIINREYFDNTLKIEVEYYYMKEFKRNSIYVNINGVSYVLAKDSLQRIIDLYDIYSLKRKIDKI